MEKVKSIIISSINLFVTLFFFIFFYIFNFRNFITWYATFPIVCVLLIYHITIFKICRLKITDFRVWFIILCYFFFFGITFLYFFGLDSYISWEIVWQFDGKYLLESNIFSICSIQALFTGFLFLKNNSKRRKINYTPDKVLFWGGIILFCVSFPCRLYFDIKNIILAQTSKSFTSVTAESGLVDDFATMFLPSIFLLLCSIKQKKMINFIVLCVLIYSSIVMILTGDRRNSVISLVVLLLFCKEKFQIKTSFMLIIILLLFSYFGICILNLLRNIRQNSLVSFSQFINLLVNSMFSSSFFEQILSAIGEFGLALFSAANVILYIPSLFNYQYGLTFLRTLLTVLPVGSIASNILYYSTMSTEINRVSGLPLGATLFGDFYSNFGCYSIFALVIFGYLLFAFINYKDKNKNAQISVYFSLFYFNLNLVRATLAEVVRPSVWFLFFIFLIRCFDKKVIDY